MDSVEHFMDFVVKSFFDCLMISHITWYSIKRGDIFQ